MPDDEWQYRDRHRAYELWQDAGRPDGQHRRFWDEAERELKRADQQSSASNSDRPDDDTPPKRRERRSSCCRGSVMFAIVVPGKVGAVSVRYASATEALKKYRELEDEGVINIDLRDARGEPVGAFDLEQLAKSEAEDDDRATARGVPPAA